MSFWGGIIGLVASSMESGVRVLLVISMIMGSLVI